MDAQHNLQVRIDQDDYRRLRLLAAHYDISLASFVRETLRERLADTWTAEEEAAIRVKP